MTIEGVCRFHDLGVAFEYPEGWELEVTEEGGTTTVALHSTAGPAFALVTLDDGGPDPGEVADEALEAMREEYPALDAVPASGRVAGREAAGHDAEFVSLDLPNACAIRCFRSGRRTVFLFGQWPEGLGEEGEAAFELLLTSFQEAGP